MEVVIPSTTQSMDFEFNNINNSMSVVNSPYSTAPPSPKRFGEYYFSAPTSPSRVSDFYRDFEEFSTAAGAGSERGYGSSRSPPMVPFEWEENPGTPKKGCVVVEKDNDGDDDGGGGGGFAFDFSEDLERTSLSAEELFDGGKIKPLKPPPRLQFLNHQPSSSSNGQDSIYNNKKNNERERGRERNIITSMGDNLLSSSRSSRRATRSLSPLRASDQRCWEEEDHQRQPINKNDNKERSFTASSNVNNNPTKVSSSSSSSKKWRFRDFLLFRSASEGRANEKDPLRKYYMKKHEDLKNASFRSTDSFGSNNSGRRKGPPVSAHELHYTVNKAVSDDLKKKTFLPYKQGILGRLAFNPALHALANGFGSLTRAS
ncbi:uncharacterized protein LOC115695461 [Cannabis sativa]|uniref:Uncharacterized protein n=2 Tax=Cannabis sativa TaxID=3483 RepID=A0A7J6DKC1_CANSA|nr:uncharacterized protein LOC115695461 [Cannabis sativa]KAF4346568.1 hypothetical protein G4B88_025162 [Cannabis sativa]